jgi:hypothetical protein
VAPRLEALVREGLARLPELWREVLAGTLAVC